MGLRSNAPSVLETDRAWLLGSVSVDEPALVAAATRRAAEPGFVSTAPDDWAIDQGLAISCVFHAVRRHCGRLIIAARPNQPVRISTDGPDLRAGSAGHRDGRHPRAIAVGEAILQAALERCDDRCLTPRSPRFAIDSSYVLAAGGLLADLDPGAAVQLMRHTLSLDAAPMSAGAKH